MADRSMDRLGDTKLKLKSFDYIHLFFLFEDIEAAIKKYAFGDILDIGCGNKPYEKWYAPVTSKQTGCDIVQSNLNKVDVVCPATDLHFPDNSFDSVLSTQVMEHVFDNRKLIGEAYRVLKPGGQMILTVPFCWQLHEEPYDFFRVSKYGLQELFSEAGFEVITIKANGGKWAATFQMFINTVYSTFRYKTVKAKILKILFVEFRLTALVNRLAVWIDKRHFDDLWTLNYLIVAKKNIK